LTRFRPCKLKALLIKLVNGISVRREGKNILMKLRHVCFGIMKGPGHIRRKYLGVFVVANRGRARWRRRPDIAGWLKRKWRECSARFAAAGPLVVVAVVGIFVFVANAAVGDISLSPPTGPATGGTIVTMTSGAGGSAVWSNQVINFPFGGSAGTTGMEQTFTAPVAGLYKLEVWGAQGGNAPTGGQGGKGGYSTVTVQLNAGQIIYISSGGQGGAANASTGIGGWNGGGGTNNNTGGGGGGASHISLSSGLLSNATVRTNLLVAAGGGGGTQNNGNAGCHGGWGGGTTGGSSQSNVGGAGACTGNGASGGTQTAGGTTLASQGASGSAGQGATSTQQGGSIYAGGGGGGYFGGGAANGTGGGGGGGSGWLRTAALNSVAITNSSTIAGNSTITEPNGTTATGHTGAGYARVTILSAGLFVKPTVQFGSVTIADANVTWCNYNGSTCTNGGAPNTVTFITPARGSLPATNNVWLTFDPSKTGEFTYYTPATSYTHLCLAANGVDWVSQRSIAANTATICRIVLNNAFSGTISLADSYASNINPSLSGSFASADSRFNAGTATFTVDYTDTYNSTGQTLTYTYTSPAWNTLISNWNPDGSNQVNLMRPTLTATAVSNSGVPDIVLAGDNLVLSILAESYKIIPPDRFSELSESMLSITTYGAIYNGTITISEDLSNSDCAGGSSVPCLSGVFNSTTINFGSLGLNGADYTGLRYTPKTTAVSPNYIIIKGSSAGPNITNDSINIHVIPKVMLITGPLEISRGETHEYTVTVYSPDFNILTLDDFLNGTGILAGGVFSDTSATNGYPGGTFSGGKYYDVSSCTIGTLSTSACVRTFTYTAPSNLVNTSSYIRLDINAETGDFAFLNVDVVADALTFACSASNPTCTIAYVGESQIYDVRPNGVFTGSTVLSSPDASSSFGSSSTISWSNSSGASGVSYTPGAPGRYVLSANVTSSPDPNMNGKTFYSNSTDSLNDYIWVIANKTTFFTGDDTIPNGGSGTYTLALNGPFVGTVILSDNDTVNGIPQGGTFDNGGICDFTFSNYSPSTNTSTCTFTYTPTIAAEERTITLAPGFPPEFARPMDIDPIDITVYGFPDIRFINPIEGPSIGDNTVWITGAGLKGVSFITFGGEIDGITNEVMGGSPCTNLHIISDTIVTCNAPAHVAGQVNVFANNIIPPDDIDNTDPNNPIITPRDPVQYTYFEVAEDFVNECYVGGVWTTEPRVAPGTTVNCRVVLDGRWNGPVQLSDDWHDTIDPGLKGTFTSSDSRFNSSTSTFSVTYTDTVDSTGQTLNYTWTSPSWNTLKSYWISDGSNEDDLWWPLINVEIPIDEYESIYLTSSGDDVVFGMLAQEYFMELNGVFPFFCTGCEIAFNLSTYGAPYEGTIALSENLSSSDNSSGTPGVFGAEGVFGNNVIHFSGSDGAVSGFGFVPNTTATGSNFIRICGTSSTPSISDSCFDISPIIDAGIKITPAPNSTSLARGGTGTYTLEITIGPTWGGTIQLSDVFNIGGSGNGVFADVTTGPNPVGTFNPSTNTYTFSSGETYIRTFTYTLRDDSVSGPLFPSYIMQLTAESNSPNNHAYTNVYVDANRIMTKCSLSYPNCTIAYVGVLQDYALQPNGMLVGTGSVSASDAGLLGTATWSAAAPFTMSYTPTAPGRQIITTTITNSVNSGLIGKSFQSTASDSLNDHIWVMANQMTITGPSYLRYGVTGTFTLTMNGPFIGTIDLSDLLGGSPAGGVFSPDDLCTFDLLDYDFATNTTSCNFDYTPDLFEYMTNVVLSPSTNSYIGPMSGTSLSVTIYGRPIIDTVSPDSGPTIGGIGFDISHDPNGIIIVSGTNLATGSALNFDSLFMGNIPVNLSSINIIDDDNISFVPPPNAAGGVDVTVGVGPRIYHHPDYYTYIPELISINPTLGPTTGGQGFGVSYDPNGVVTITGNDITGASRYSDGTNQYYGLGWLDFNGSQYIDTNVNQLGNTTMTLDATRNSGQYVAGVLVAGDYYVITLPTSGFMLPTANYGNANATAGGAMNSGDRISATLSADGTKAMFTVSLNGGSNNFNQIVPGTLPHTPYNIYLGSANNGAGIAGGMIGKVYSFSIDKDSDADDRNLVPVCTMDGLTGGMFDTLHNVFYPSNGAPFSCDNSSITPPTVHFDNTKVSASNIVVVDLNTIKVIPPAHDEGLVDVVVTVNDLVLTLTDAYTYRMPLTIYTVYPPTGSIDGGDVITITGHNFISFEGPPSLALPISVTLDIEGVSAVCVIANVATDVTNDSIICTTAAHDPGLVSVTVNNSVEIDTMAATIDPGGSNMPVLNKQGRSIGGFLYMDDIFLQIDASASSVVLNIAPTSPFDQDYVSVGVTTNNPSGYSLYIESSGANLICATNSSLVIPPTIGNAIDAKTWGFQVGASTTSTGWASTPTTPTLIAANSGPTFAPSTSPTAENTQVNFAVRDGQPPLTPCSVYKQVVTYSAITN